MANTYSQIYIQVIFAVKNRECLIPRIHQDEVNKYISSIITNKNQKSIIVNGVSNHIHCFFGLNPNTAVSDIVRDIKNNSSKFITNSGFVKGRFNWQEGFGAFSYSHSQLNNVYNYILNQESHHKVKSFKEEYLEFLLKNEIVHSDRYLFDWIE